MKAAVISVTERGRQLSERIAPLFDTERYCYTKHTDENAETFDDIMALTGNIFQSYDIIIFICAAGIAVRAISPHIVSKLTDPAVIVIDDCGRYVIPILSGHIGGANRTARYISEKTGAQAVITTATDTGGHFSPDSMAAANGLIITDMEKAKLIASAVLDGEKIGLYSTYEYVDIPDELSAESQRCGICISDGDIPDPFPVTLHLIPKNITLGIGCRRGTSADDIEACVSSALGKTGVNRIEAVATIDIKKDEQGLVSYCKRLGVKLITYTAAELMRAEGDFSSSEFVRSVTGVDNVCERSAVMGGGRLIVKKTALSGVTVAAAKRDITIDLAGK